MNVDSIPIFILTDWLRKSHEDPLPLTLEPTLQKCRELELELQNMKNEIREEKKFWNRQKIQFVSETRRINSLRKLIYEDRK